VALRLVWFALSVCQPGGQVVVPAGWRGGLVVIVLHCHAPDDFSLAVVSAADGLAHHPRRTDPATGGLVYNSPLVLRQVPAARVQDSAVWVVVFKAGEPRITSHHLSCTLISSCSRPVSSSHHLASPLITYQTAAKQARYTSKQSSPHLTGYGSCRLCGRLRSLLP